jgi:hypothetical protein
MGFDEDTRALEALQSMRALLPKGAPVLACANPFAWKLDDDTFARTTILDARAKKVALEGARAAVHSSLAGVSFGCVVSTPTEVALAAQCGVSFLAIPGEVCRQADVLDACVEAGLPVVLERGAFLPPSDARHARTKLEGLPVCLIDAGGANGYADRVLDPRALWTLAAACIGDDAFGVNIGELLSPAGATYAWKPLWLEDARFLDPLVLTARALGTRAYAVPADPALLARVSSLLTAAKANQR